MKNTVNYNLKKPEATDNYNVQDQNENMDIIDSELKGQVNALVSHLADDATTTQKGHVQLGTGAGQAAVGNHNHDSAYTPKAALNSVSANKTLTLTDANDVLNCTNAAAITVTVPPNSSVAFPIGTVIAFIREGAGDVSFAPGSDVTLNSSGAKRKIKAQYDTCALIKTGTDKWELAGTLTT